MVSVFISSVPRVRARPGRAALMAKFMHASSSREWMPAWVIPWGLQARSVGREGPGHPPEVLAVHAVVGEGTTDQRR